MASGVELSGQSRRVKGVELHSSQFRKTCEQILGHVSVLKEPQQQMDLSKTFCLPLPRLFKSVSLTFWLVASSLFPADKNSKNR